MRFAVEEFFSYKSFHARKKKNWVPTSYLQEEYKIRRWVFCPTSCSSQESEGFFCRQATCKGKYGKAKEAIESARAGLSPKKRGREKVKKKKRKEKDQGRQEGGSSEGKVPCALNQEFLFFGSRVFGFGSGPSRLKYRLLRDLVYEYEEAMCEGSSGNGLLYAAKAEP